jgi:hypothetical protein
MASIEDKHPISQVAHYPQVMGDEQQCRTIGLLHIQQ